MENFTLQYDLYVCGEPTTGTYSYFGPERLSQLTTVVIRPLLSLIKVEACSERNR